MIIPERNDSLLKLSPREMQVINRIVEEKSHEEIAADLGIAVITVKGHQDYACFKLQIANRRDAIAGFLQQPRSVDKDLPRAA